MGIVPYPRKAIGLPQNPFLFLGVFMYNKKPNFVAEFRKPHTGEERLTDFSYPEEDSFFGRLSSAWVCVDLCLKHLDNVISVADAEAYKKEFKKILAVRKKIQRVQDKLENIQKTMDKIS